LLIYYPGRIIRNTVGLPVKRNHGIDQNRLVKELRLESISTIVQANTFLRETYLPKMNARFGRPALSDEDA
jgi:hypothetical protein